MRVRELEERERKESKKLADEDALRKIRVAEETIEHLQKKLAATKQVSVLCFKDERSRAAGCLCPKETSDILKDKESRQTVISMFAFVCHFSITSTLRRTIV